MKVYIYVYSLNEVIILGVMILHPRVIGYLIKTKDQEWEIQRSESESHCEQYRLLLLPVIASQKLEALKTTHILDTGLRN